MIDVNEIRNFLEEYSGEYAENENADIFDDLKIKGDDFHEMMANLESQYNVNMKNYLWYYHTNEEGFSIGSHIVKPPYERVKRIPITPLMLVEFVNKGKWDVVYPNENIPLTRYDILIDRILFIGVILAIIFTYFKN